MFKTNLVQTTTADDLLLSGLLNRPAIKQETAIVFIHGFLYDFYTHEFVRKISEAAVQKGFAFLAAQNRGSGIQTAVLTSDRKNSKTLGSYFELIEEATLDIDAWIKFLQNLGYTKFILVGHSLGTYKVIRYLIEGAYKTDITKVSLLGPFDKNVYVEKKSSGKWPQYVEEAKKKIDSGKALEFIPDTYDDFPMTMQTFYSWYRPGELNEMWDFYRHKEYTFPIWEQIKIPVQIVTGTSDESLEYPAYYSRDEAYGVMKSHINSLDLQLIEGSGHTFVGFEEKLASVFGAFLKT
jgi:pimeloyl-ACP methyl ester carboxylesterase